ncbi:hypothetical protein [Streptomyces sp. NPDC057301]|uniref:hypothetical protein n=1 Tax=Streptomyces sp. NPDC057301 TaxID=3346093 RepID=UPI003633D4BA
MITMDPRHGTLPSADGVDLPHLLTAADAGATSILQRVEKTGRQWPGTPPQAWQSLPASIITPT